MENKYDFTQIPINWKFCFNSGCPLSGKCLRYQTGLHLPDDRVWGQAVFPTAEKDGRCEFFCKDEKVRLATGFVVEGNPTMSQQFRAMRHPLTNYLGGNGTYYLYRNGQKWLSPRQQADIQRLFRKFGYSTEVVYRIYRDEYDFTQ